MDPQAIPLPPPAPFPALLAGIRVLDASRVLAGPFCGQSLGDLGAEVVKIERPGSGDETRAWGPPFLHAGPSAYYLSCNRNKLGIALDLSKPQGRDVFHDLVRHSDVVLENFRAESAEKLGLSARRLLEINPRVIVCSISGFGRSGPMSDLPGYDFAIQALSGLMSITGPVEGPPCKVGVAVTDVLTGLYAASAVLACLIARGKSGHGYSIDLALLDCALAAQVNVAQAFLTGLDNGLPSQQAVPARQGNAHLQIVPYQLFSTADGWIVLAVGNDGQWKKFADAAAPHLAKEERFATNPGRVQHREELVPLVEAVMRSKTTKQWEEVLQACGVPHAPLWKYSELFSHRQAAERGLKITVRDPAGRPIDLVASPFRVSSTGEPSAPPEATTPPNLGEHTDSVLKQWCGLDEERLRRLRAEGVIG
jgi:crotonobetainyl-CoA:carnitine CoA-transferase CaiB-like acyl-CoA transferase